MAFKKEVTRTQFIESDLLNYYESITQKPVLCVEAKRANLENGIFVLDMANMILLFVYERYKLYQCIDLTVLILPENAPKNKDDVQIKYESFQKRNVNGYPTEACKVLEMNEHGTYSTLFDVRSCDRPLVFVQQKSLMISGLSSVLRFLFKFSTLTRKRLQGFDEIDNMNREMELLLGFRKGCLQACAEASVWTKFCEVDMTQRMISALVEATRALWSGSVCELPKDLLRFEYHLAQPVKIHNFRKRAQQEGKVYQFFGSQANTHQFSGSSVALTHSCNVSYNSCIEIPSQNPQLYHDFAEGPDITLSDIVLFPCVELVKTYFGVRMINYLPKVDAWYHRVKLVLKETPLRIQLLNENMPVGLPNVFTSFDKLILPAVPQESLYQNDSARDKTKQFTKQADIEAAIQLITEAGIQPMSAGLEPEIQTSRPFLDWESLPPLVHPEQGGQLPKKRREKKCDQLANLVKWIQFVDEGRRSTSSNVNRCDTARSPLQIVDFCSGGGHVGILVAWLFPDSRVVLVENKEESVRRAIARVDKLKLNNISVFQCNLNSFDAQFDIGMALHACGTATDLVLEKCSRSKASFIVCPCCYGAIRGNHVLHYPRSSTFRESGLTVSQYFVIAHAADQTHDEQNVKTAQGRLSMRTIDTDRLFYLQEHGYETWLGKMIPESASPKNHILIGIAKSLN